MTADRSHRAGGRSYRGLTVLAAAAGGVGLVIAGLGAVGGPDAVLGPEPVAEISHGATGAAASPVASTTPAPSVSAHERPAARSAPRAARLPAYHVHTAPPPLVRKPVEVSVAYTLRVGTLNVLGSNHTHNSKQWAPGVVRTAREASAVEARGIDVIGFQEMQTDQIGVLQRDLGGYDIWPGTALGSNGYRLQVAWRSDKLELVDTGTVSTVFSHQMRPLPWVKLRSRANGGEFYFVTLHNSPRGLESERDSATGAEIGLLNQLLSTGLPVIVVGDTNEPYEFYCRVAPATGMAALNGSSVAGGCSVPHPSGLDWVMGGSRGTPLSFSDYHREDMPGMSDHPIVFGAVTLTTTVRRDPVSGRIVK